MSEPKKAAQKLWATINQSAKITGYRADYLRQLALSFLEQPVEERPLKVRYRSNRYEFWLPDLIHYLDISGDTSAKIPAIEPIWVTTTEGAEITGYNAPHLQLLAREMWQQPEAERIIRVRNRSRRYELWLPDLMAYIQNIGHGPYNKPSKRNS